MLTLRGVYLSSTFTWDCILDKHSFFTHLSELTMIYMEWTLMIESYVSLKALASVTQFNRKPVKSKVGQYFVLSWTFLGMCLLFWVMTKHTQLKLRTAIFYDGKYENLWYLLSTKNTTGYLTINQDESYLWRKYFLFMLSLCQMSLLGAFCFFCI